jgi:predicted DCC family thiol-disulfide oxidoreductase YuxK
MKHPTHRIIKIVQYEPWLLGWCRWEITADLHYCCGPAVCTTLAKGRWKWRGRKARLFEAHIKGDPYWSGPPVSGTL